MGRMLGAFDSDNNNDRPDLNKCPDCGCFFAQDHCPLCGKLCPEEMRAGNRKPVKPEKRKNRHSSGRVTFVEWYHSWWFILLMMFLMPIVGIILLLTSPHKRSLKITVVVIAIATTILSTVGFGVWNFLINSFDPPVDTSKSREEYIAACESIDAEKFYRMADSYEEKFVSMTLTVVDKFTDGDAYEGDKYATYYICTDTEGKELHFIIRDCVQDKSQNFITGDVIRIYGEGAGNYSVYDEEYNLHNAPAIFVAYFDFVE